MRPTGAAAAGLERPVARRTQRTAMTQQPTPPSPLRRWTDRAGATIADLVSRERRRLYCIGTAKSGTHSVAEMFAPPVRSQHEPDHRHLIDVVVDAAEGRLSEDHVRKWLRSRDRRLMLDVDSSHMNFFILDALLRAHRRARFLLTIRDCYSWLNSMMKHSLRYTHPHPAWGRFREFRFRGDGLVHAPEERALQEKGLYTIDGYLAYWAMHNETALRKVPAQRLLVVRTDQITARAAEIASFARLPVHVVQTDRSHAFANPDRSSLLDEIPPAFLEERVERHCRKLMSQFFPEIERLADARM